jgi:uncharacterized protein (TIGR02271 family)
MQTFTALFASRADAERAQAQLSSAGINASNASIHDQDTAGFSSAGESGTGFFGSLKDMFVPDEDSQTYGEGLRRGHALLTVQADDAQADRVHQMLESTNALDVDETASSWRNEGWSGPASGAGFAPDTRSQQNFTGDTTARATTGGDQVIPIVEEQLAVGKRQVERGGVRVRSYVRETPVHEQVSLREEHVDVERRPVNASLSQADLTNAFQERSFEVTETAEEAVVAKNARVVEEVVVHKSAGEHVEQIDDTVRRTEVDVDQIGTDRTTADRTSTDRGALFPDKDRDGRIG